MEKEGISRIINDIEIQITKYEAELAKSSGELNEKETT